MKKLLALLFLSSSLCLARAAVWFDLSNSAHNYAGGNFQWSVANCSGGASGSDTYSSAGFGGSSEAWIGDGSGSCTNSWTFVAGTPAWMINAGYGSYVGLDLNQHISINENYQPTTNVTQCVQNTTGQDVIPYATLGGTPLDGPIILSPGQSWCYTATMNRDGSSGNFVVGYTVPTLLGNDGQPVDGSQTFNPTNGYTQQYSTNSLGNGGTGGTGGGATTNTFTTTTTNYSETIWTNNINWPTASGQGGGSTNGSTVGLALDSTLRAGLGQIHADLNGQQVTLTEIQGTLNGVESAAQVMTNLQGQEIAAIYKISNWDGINLALFAGYITNNAGQNAQSIDNSINSMSASNTAALGAVASAITNNAAGPSVLTNLDTTMVGISNIFSTLTDTTNGDFATETTQLGMSNLLSQIATNGGNFPTNLAQQNTLVGISNLLGSLMTNGFDTNSFSKYYSGLTPYLSPSLTNIAAPAVSGVQSAVSGVQSAAGGLDTGVPAGDPPIFDVDASPPGMAGTFVFHIDFTASPWMSIWNTLKAMSTWLLVVAYLFYVVKSLMEHVKLWASAQTGGVPDLQVDVFAIGANALGALAYVIIAAVVLSLIGAVFLGAVDYVLFGTLSVSTLISDAGGSAAVFSFADTKAMYLVQLMFPLSFAITLLVSALIWRLGLFGVSAFVMTFMRIIPAK